MGIANKKWVIMNCLPAIVIGCFMSITNSIFKTGQVFSSKKKYFELLRFDNLLHHVLSLSVHLHLPIKIFPRFRV